MKRIIQLGISGLASSLTLFAMHSAQAQSSADLVAAALSHPDRPSEEAQDDARRMPLEVLSFWAVGASWTETWSMKLFGCYHAESSGFWAAMDNARRLTIRQQF